MILKYHVFLFVGLIVLGFTRLSGATTQLKSGYINLNNFTKVVEEKIGLKIKINKKLSGGVQLGGVGKLSIGVLKQLYYSALSLNGYAAIERGNLFRG